MTFVSFSRQIFAFNIFLRIHTHPSEVIQGGLLRRVVNTTSSSDLFVSRCLSQRPLLGGYSTDPPPSNGVRCLPAISDQQPAYIGVDSRASSSSGEIFFLTCFDSFTQIYKQTIQIRMLHKYFFCGMQAPEIGEKSNVSNDMPIFLPCSIFFHRSWIF